MRSVLIYILLSQGLNALAFVSPYFARCETAKKFEYDPNPIYRKSVIDWVKAESADLGFKQFVQEPDSLTISVGNKAIGVLVKIDGNSCQEISRALDALKSIFQNNLYGKINRIVFLFEVAPSKSVSKMKVFYKEFRVSQSNLANWLEVDQNPTLIAGDSFKKFSQNFDSVKKDLQRYVGAAQVQEMDARLKNIFSITKSWTAEKVATFQEQVEKNSFADKMKFKMQDLRRKVILYDQVRRGLWSQAQQTVSEIHFPSEKLKAEMSKGRQNLENILQVIKADTINTENEIKQYFEESKKFFITNSSST